MFELQGADLTAAAPADHPARRTGLRGRARGPGPAASTREDVVDQLPAAAGRHARRARSWSTPRWSRSLPPYTDADAEALAERANEITANGIALTAGDTTVQVDAADAAHWIGPTTANGTLDLAINPDAVERRSAGPVLRRVGRAGERRLRPAERRRRWSSRPARASACCGANSADAGVAGACSTASRRSPSRSRSPSPSSPPRRPRASASPSRSAAATPGATAPPPRPARASPPTTTPASPGSPTSTASPTSCGAR